MSIMKGMLLGSVLVAMAIRPATATGAGRVVEVTYPPSDRPGELVYGVAFRAWIPDGVERLRGVIVHQHGCGAGACRGGETAADDLQWQALARKWDCALLGPSYKQEDGQDCRLWCDPRNGSRARFLQALGDLASKSGRDELSTVPWCLWGHSGGGFWASLMMTSDPDRVVAAWLRSGTAFGAWEKGEVPKPEIGPATYQVPVMCNPGAKEAGDKRFDGAWTGARGMFRAYRAEGAPIGLAPDPRTAHECGDSRTLAIPFFDACLAARLPARGSTSARLKPLDPSLGWLAAAPGEEAGPAGSFRGDAKQAVWLPGERVARAWAEYVKDGAVADDTPPPSPTSVKVITTPDQPPTITWEAEADLESGLRQFLIKRDGKEVGRVPEKPIGKYGRPQFQPVSYHDTPERPLPEMRFLDPGVGAGEPHEYRVIAVNGAVMESAASAPAGSR